MNRFDDPEGIYRVLYAATDRVGSFIECLGTFRPDPHVFEEYEQIVDRPGDDLSPAFGEVPSSWVRERSLGVGTLNGRYADIGHHESIEELWRALSGRALHHGLQDLDAGAIRVSAPRAFTQEISRYVFRATSDGRPAWQGIVYRSRFGDDLENWAIFEPHRPEDISTSSFAEDDPDLLSALEHHALTLTR